MSDDTLDSWERMARSPILYQLLPDHSVAAVTDVLVWAEFMQTADRRVAEAHAGPYWVSTIFLGVDSLGTGDVFETMVFDPAGKPALTTFMQRYPTWDAAAAGHDWVLAQVRAFLQLAGR